MSCGVVRPMVASKPGWIQMDNIDMTSHPYNSYNYICHATDLFLKRVGLDQSRPSLLMQ